MLHEPHSNTPSIASISLPYPSNPNTHSTLSGTGSLAHLENLLCASSSLYDLMGL
jgi:hypothetical protein